MSVLGSPFHNPYTFLPFEKPIGGLFEQTLLSADESTEGGDRDRFTGVLVLRVQTLSPLLSCVPKPMPLANGGLPHRAALRVSDRLVVPASGVRGSLRNLLTVITSGVLDETVLDARLCQGRDVQLGPRHLVPQHNQHHDIPRCVFLARVEELGSEHRPGTVRLNGLTGDAALIRTDDPRLTHQVLNRRAGQRDSRGKVALQDGTMVRLSGRPVGPPDQLKHEGLYQPSDQVMTLPESLWTQYREAHRHSAFPELQKGDLIWLEPRDPKTSRLNSADDVRSIQWSRFGRRGAAAKDLLKQDVVPKLNGSIDRATDLFGYVFGRGDRKGDARVARVRPENLVFDEGCTTERVTLAVMGQPHPGCIGFYRVGDPVSVSGSSPLRGYKVYRNTKERGPSAPWHYEVQGVYGNNGELLPADGRMTCTCELICEGAIGSVRIALRSMTRTEVRLLLALCGVDWRLGGGKPLGLGHCRVIEAELLDEFGQQTSLLDQQPWKPLTSEAARMTDRSRRTMPPNIQGAHIEDRIGTRLDCYQATQRPVERLRYPRLAVNGASGGHLWFSTLCQPRMGGGAGLYARRVVGALAQNGGELSGQCLPEFDPANPMGDVLYGHACSLSRQGNRERATFQFAAPQVPNRPNQGPQGQNAQTRRANRDQRG